MGVKTFIAMVLMTDVAALQKISFLFFVTFSKTKQKRHSTVAKGRSTVNGCKAKKLSRVSNVLQPRNAVSEKMPQS